MSKWPAQVALCNAVMPSSSSSPSNEASNNNAKGSKLTRRHCQLILSDDPLLPDGDGRSSRL
ncbi:hypothetical protein DERP_005543 [Dermatophagoides pteronyssinus]|uniref:Uncharacterized protein n=1 Tax=Dermatophagoides pteronyssinus TaxID=6956 RepID=A0ABQ8JMX1_DERPT|nr:hypothetical protein DERP_005543 [Dermatophagoides pteronyssinus]